MLWEIEQIKKLKASYFRYLDSKQWRKYRSVFTDDAKVWILGEGMYDSPTPTYESVDDFVAFMETGHDKDHVVSVHQGHMPEITILDEQNARGIWSMFDWVERPMMRTMQGFGHYYEEYVKGDDGKWRIRIFKLTRLRVYRGPSDLPEAPHYGHVPKVWWD